MGDGEVAARWHGVHNGGDDAMRVVFIADGVEDGEHQHADGAGEVQSLRGLFEYRLRITEVGVDVVGGGEFAREQARAWARTTGSLST